MCSTRACPRSSSGPTSAVASSDSAAAKSPGGELRPGGRQRPRRARCAGSGVRAAARSRNAAAAAMPPRPCARPAERISSAATSSSGAVAACARCQARRSGSARGRWRRPAHGGRRGGPPPTPRGRPPSARGGGETAPGAELEQAVARRRVARPARSRAPGGPPQQRRDRHRIGGRQQHQPLRRLGQLAPAAAVVVLDARRQVSRVGASAKPPASSAGLRPRGSSSSASGLPRVSATIRSRTRRRARPGITLASSARASHRRGPPSASCRQAHQLALAARLAHGEHQAQPLGRAAVGDEAEHLGRGAVEPLRVVDQAQQRPLLAQPRPAGSAWPARRGSGRARRRPSDRTRRSGRSAGAPEARRGGASIGAQS